MTDEWCSSSYLFKKPMASGAARCHLSGKNLGKKTPLADFRNGGKWKLVFNWNWKRVTWHCQSRLILCLGRRVACTWRHPISTAKVGPCKTLARVSKHQRKMRVTLIWFWNQTCSLFIFFLRPQTSKLFHNRVTPFSHMSWYNGATRTCLCFYHGVFLWWLSATSEHVLCKTRTSTRCHFLMICFSPGGRQTDTYNMHAVTRQQSSYIHWTGMVIFLSEPNACSSCLNLCPHNCWQVDETKSPSTSTHCHACFQPFREASGWVPHTGATRKKYGHAFHHPIFLTILQPLDQVLPRSFPREGGMSRRLVGQENVLGLQVGVGHLAARKRGMGTSPVSSQRWIDPLWRTDRCLSITWLVKSRNCSANHITQLDPWYAVTHCESGNTFV